MKVSFLSDSKVIRNVKSRLKVINYGGSGNVRHIPPEEFARLARCDYRTYRGYAAQGGRKLPNLATATRMAQVAGVTLDWLVGLSDNPVSDETLSDTFRELELSPMAGRSITAALKAEPDATLKPILKEVESGYSSMSDAVLDVLRPEYITALASLNAAYRHFYAKNQYTLKRESEKQKALQADLVKNLLNKAVKGVAAEKKIAAAIDDCNKAIAESNEAIRLSEEEFSKIRDNYIVYILKVILMPGADTFYREVYAPARERREAKKTKEKKPTGKKKGEET